MRSTISVATWLSSRTSRKISLRSARAAGTPRIVEQAQPRLGVRDNGRERLLDVVHDRGGKLTDQREPGRVQELDTQRGELALRMLELGNVAAGVQHRTVWIATR